ncbi:MAG: GDP-L-fucose synthase [Muribaculaceae bacterium]|nr:GDP-L-fucose synthase [Muribaculaceae bacterium]
MTAARHNNPETPATSRAKGASQTETLDNVKGFNSDTKIYVAGHRGLVGSAIWRNLEHRGFSNLVGRTHQQLDLTDSVAVRHFFDAEQPEVVILAAAKVGGIMANNTYRADFIVQNLAIQQNVITEAWRHGVKHLLFLGSTCIYPREAHQPIREDALLTAPLEYTNEPYAIAKIAGMKMCESLNLQYGTDYLSVMPTNLYGPNDNFHLENGHVLPAMVRKTHLAKLLSKGDFESIRVDFDRRPVSGYDPRMTDKDIANLLARFGIYPDVLQLWGSGKPLREFLWSEDMADAAVHILLNVRFEDLAKSQLPLVRNTHINIGTGIEHTIAQTTQIVKDAVGFTGDILWDNTKPDGTMRKLCDVTKLHELGWRHSVELDEGIKRLYAWYCDDNSGSSSRADKP